MYLSCSFCFLFCWLAAQGQSYKGETWQLFLLKAAQVIELSGFRDHKMCSGMKCQDLGKKGKGNLKKGRERERDRDREREKCARVENRMGKKD